MSERAVGAGPIGAPVDLPVLSLSAAPPRVMSGAGLGERAGAGGDRPALRLALGGDLALSGRTPSDALSSLTSALSASDLLLANLEGSLLDPPAVFAAPTGRAASLASAGITHLVLANNHTRDHGAAGLASTIDAVTSAGIVPVGLEAEDPLVVAEGRGVRLGILAAARTRQTQPDPPRFRELEPERLVAEVASARRRVDALVVSLHLGFMYVDYPSPEHRELCHRLVVAGADLVVCHHAHVLQGFERVGRSLIAYNLGNLLVDPDEGSLANPGPPGLQREGGLLVVELDRGGLVGATFVPTVIDDQLRLAWPAPERATAILARLERISDFEGSAWIEKFARQRAARNTDLGVAELWSLVRQGRFRAFARMLGRARPEHAGMLWRRFVGRRA